MDNIKKCPFCGNEGEIIKSLKGKYYIKCVWGCFARTAKYGAKEYAIEAWNRRAEV